MKYFNFVVLGGETPRRGRVRTHKCYGRQSPLTYSTHHNNGEASRHVAETVAGESLDSDNANVARPKNHQKLFRNYLQLKKFSLPQEWQRLSLSRNTHTLHPRTHPH